MFFPNTIFLVGDNYDVFKKEIEGFGGQSSINHFTVPPFLPLSPVVSHFSLRPSLMPPLGIPQSGWKH